MPHAVSATLEAEYASYARCACLRLISLGSHGDDLSWLESGNPMGWRLVGVPLGAAFLKRASQECRAWIFN